MDRGFFIAEIETCSDMMYRVAWSILRNEADVQDALQDAVLKAWEKWNKLREEKFFRTWLVRILINVCYPTGITLSGGFSNLDTWPQIPYTQMISVDQIPETIHLMIPDASGNDTTLILQLKKKRSIRSAVTYSWDDGAPFGRPAMSIFCIIDRRLPQGLLLKVLFHFSGCGIHSRIF